MMTGIRRPALSVSRGRTMSTATTSVLPYNSVAVAELTLGLLLAVDRAIPDNTAELRAGHWDKKRFAAVGRGLYGRSMGIVGLGTIARVVEDGLLRDAAIREASDEAGARARACRRARRRRGRPGR